MKYTSCWLILKNPAYKLSSSFDSIEPYVWMTHFFPYLLILHRFKWRLSFWQKSCQLVSNHCWFRILLIHCSFIRISNFSYCMRIWTINKILYEKANSEFLSQVYNLKINWKLNFYNVEIKNMTALYTYQQEYSAKLVC